jgi:hypothetical protein
MKTIKEIYKNRLSTWMDECKTNIRTYESDFREDEANLEKIKLNVYTIFSKMFTLSLNKTETKEAFKTMYLEYHKNIPTNWYKAREHAQAHNTIDVYVEDIKIDTATRIEKFFLNVWDQHEQS